MLKTAFAFKIKVVKQTVTNIRKSWQQILSKFVYLDNKPENVITYLILIGGDTISQPMKCNDNA